MGTMIGQEWFETPDLLCITASVSLKAELRFALDCGLAKVYSFILLSSVVDFHLSFIPIFTAKSGL